MIVSFNLWALIILPIVFVLLLRWPKLQVDIIEDSRVGIFRRIAAFYVDISVCTIGILPLVSMPPLFLEYLATGEWQWSFERDFVRRADLLNLTVFFIGLYGMFYYFSWHFKNGKQTLGQHFLGFKLVPAGERPNMFFRAVVAHFNFSWWPTWPWTLFRKKQDYWWDTASKIKARRVKSR